MVAAVVLDVIAFIIIFVEVEGYSEVRKHVFYATSYYEKKHIKVSQISSISVVGDTHVD